MAVAGTASTARIPISLTIEDTSNPVMFGLVPMPRRGTIRDENRWAGEGEAGRKPMASANPRISSTRADCRGHRLSLHNWKHEWQTLGQQVAPARLVHFKLEERRWKSYTSAVAGWTFTSGPLRRVASC